MEPSKRNSPPLSRALSVVNKASLMPSANSTVETEKLLAVQIHLTRLNSKTEPDQYFDAEFLRIFRAESPEAIQWVFQAWRNESPYFPAISDIQRLLRAWRRAQRERLELEARLEEKFLLEERRKRGEVPDYAEIVRQLRAIAERTPVSDVEERRRKFCSRISSVAQIVPALHLSEEEIAARREKEREEIRRYLENE